MNWNETLKAVLSTVFEEDDCADNCYAYADHRHQPLEFIAYTVSTVQMKSTRFQG